MHRMIAVPLAGVGLAVAVLSVMLATGTASQPAAALTNCSTTEDGLAANELMMIQLFNQDRATLGKPALKASPSLNRMAAWMAADQASHDVLAHNDSLKRDPWARAANCDVRGLLSENAAAGASDASAIFREWMNSPAHKSAIEGSYGTTPMVGMGEKNGYWTADFGSFDDSGVASGPPNPGGSPSPSPSPTKTNTPTNTPTPTATPTPGLGAYRIRMELPVGTSLMTYVGTTAPPATALASLGSLLIDCYFWDAGIQEWERYGPGAPTFAQTLNVMVSGNAYFLRVRGPAVWTY